MSDFLSRALKITIVGDSHAALFQNLLFTAPTRPNSTFVFNTQYIPDCSLSTLSTSGRLDEALYEALVRGLVILRDGTLTPFSRVSLGADTDRLLAEHEPDGGDSLDETALVFSAGHRDYLQALNALGPASDFELPIVRHGSSPIEPIGSHLPVSVALVDALIEPAVRVFGETMNILVSAGFRRLYLLGLRPPPLDDELFEHKWGLRSRSHLRYKLTMLINDRLAKACERSKVQFIDTWPILAPNGVFDDSFELDLVHLNRQAVIRIGKMIVDRYVEARSTTPRLLA